MLFVSRTCFNEFLSLLDVAWVNKVLLLLLLLLLLLAQLKAVALEKCQGAHKAKSRDVSNPTCEVLGVAANNLGHQSIFLGVSGYQAPVRQQPCSLLLVLTLALRDVSLGT